MLSNPKWGKEPSMRGFREWLKTQDPNQRFDYRDCRRCAVGQYLASCGTNWHTFNEAGREAKDLLGRMNGRAFKAAISFGRDGTATFGEVLHLLLAEPLGVGDDTL